MILFQAEEQSVFFSHAPNYHFGCTIKYVSDNYLYHVNSLDFSQADLQITSKQL